MKRVISLLLVGVCVFLFSCDYLTLNAFSATDYDIESYYNDVYDNYNYHLNGVLWDVATNESYLPIDEFAKEFEDSLWYNFCVGITNNKLDTRRCTELLINYITLFEMQTEDMIEAQVDADAKKTLGEYAEDITDIVVGTIALDSSFSSEVTETMKSISTALDISWGAAEIVIDSLDTLQYADWLLKNYKNNEVFLNAIVHHSDKEALREAARDLLLLSQKVFYYRMNMINDVAEGASLYLGKNVFFDTVVLDEMLKTPDILDLSQTDFESISMMKAAYKLVFGTIITGVKIGVFAGDALIGATNIINRAQEIIAINSIKKSLFQEATSQKRHIKSGQNESEIRNVCSAVRDIVYLNYRAVYCLHEMLVHEGQVASLSFKRNGKAVEYDELLETYKEITFSSSNILDSIFPDVEFYKKDHNENKALSETDYTLYVEILNKAIQNEYEYSNRGRGFLFDANGDGIDELFYIYEGINYQGFPSAYGAAYTIQDGKAVPIFQEDALCILAGVPNCELGVVSLNGKRYICAFGEVGSTETSGGISSKNWHLYSISNTEFLLEQSISWEYSYRESYDDGDYTITKNGQAMSLSDYNNMISSIKHERSITWRSSYWLNDNEFSDTAEWIYSLQKLLDICKSKEGNNSTDLSQYIGTPVSSILPLFDDIIEDDQYYTNGTSIYSNYYITFDEDFDKNIYSIMLHGPSTYTIYGISYGMDFNSTSEMMREGQYKIREDRDGYLMVEGNGYYLSISAFREDLSIGDTISYVTITNKSD